MSLKLGLMHLPKSPERTSTKPVVFARLRRESGVVERPMEFLIRIRETYRRRSPDWKGVLTS